MRFMRSLGRLSLGYIISSLLLITPVFFAVHTVIRSPEPAKESLRASGTYDSATTAAIEELAKQQTDPTTKALLADPGIQESIRQGFTPQLLQENAERNIDEAYAWISGKSDTLHLKIDTAAALPQITQALRNYATSYLEKLPQCSLAQTRALNSDQISSDPLSLQCRPQGINVQQVSDAFAQKATEQMKLADNSTGNVEPNATAKTAREWFELFSNYYWVPAAITTLLAGLYVLLHKNRRQGIKRLARITLSSGIGLGFILVIFTLLLNRGLTLLRDPAQVSLIQSKLTDALAPLVNDFRMTLIWWAAAYLATSIGTLVILHVHKPVAPSSTPKW